MDLGLIVSYWPRLAEAASLTVMLTVVTVAVSTVIGLPLAILSIVAGRFIAVLLALYSFIMRAVPLLLLLYLIYYGLPTIGLVFDALPTALIGMIVAATAYNMEIIKAGLLAVDKHQWESAEALGIPVWRVWIDIVVPQATPHILPPFISNATLVLKGTSVASIITIGELTAVTNGLIADTYRAFEFMLFSALVYLLLSSALTLLQSFAQRVWKAH